MKSRGMVGVVAFLLASVATMTLFLYVHGVKKKAETGGTQVSVVVSKKDIPAGTSMDVLIGEGDFTTETIPATAQIDGAITSLEQLKGHVTSVPILAGEQIPVARLQGSTELPGGTLGIPAGFEATTLQLESQRIVGGTLHPGDHVEIYGSFAPPVAPHVTVTLVPYVKVVRVSKPSTADQATNQGTLVTMALRPQDAERVIFGQEHGFVWMALVPPGQSGQRKAPVYIRGLLK
jgi:pilus assembly protein CpaB